MCWSDHALREEGFLRRPDRVQPYSLGTPLLGRHYRPPERPQRSVRHPELATRRSRIDAGANRNPIRRRQFVLRVYYEDPNPKGPQGRTSRVHGLLRSNLKTSSFPEPRSPPRENHGTLKLRECFTRKNVLFFLFLIP